MTFTTGEFLDFIESGESDRGALQAVRVLLDRHLPGILDAFYDQMWSRPELREILGTRDAIPRLKEAQTAHWRRLFADRLPEDYAETARAVGEAHSRIGLTPAWYMGAYGFILVRLARLVAARKGRRAGPLLAAMIRRIMMDMTFSLEAYESSRDSRETLMKARRDAVENVSYVAEFSTHTNQAMITLAELTRVASDVDQRSQAIAAATEEMATAAGTIARNSEAASEEVQEAEASVKEGIQVANQAVAGMERIAGAVQDSSAKVNQLTEASEKITEILGSVEAIAAQTNLLALNATIESARAGEAGKGFAVVANEVKTLAQQTSKATEDISSRIDTLKRDMAAIVSAMDGSLSAVNEGREAINRSGEEMQGVAMQVSQVNQKMDEVAGVLQQQTESTREISGGVSAIADLAARNREFTNAVSQRMDKANAVIADKVNKWAEVGTARALCEVAKIDHLIFMKRVSNTVMGGETFQVPDHHGCRLGRWYDSVTDPAILDNPAYGRLEAPHRRVHACGHRAVDKAMAHEMDEALSALQEMSRASGEVLGLLEELSRSLEA